jgi:hypothetical protein
MEAGFGAGFRSSAGSWNKSWLTWVILATPSRLDCGVSDQKDNEEISQLRRLNADLTRSLRRCRVLLDDCRAKLAANSNEPTDFDNDDETDDDESDLA